MYDARAWIKILVRWSLLRTIRTSSPIIEWKIMSRYRQQIGFALLARFIIQLIVNLVFIGRHPKSLSSAFTSPLLRHRNGSCCVCVCMQSYELFITGLFTDYLSLHVVVLLINNTLKSRWTLCFFHQLFFSLTLLNVLKLRWFTRVDLLFNVMQAFFRHFFEGNH